MAVFLHFYTSILALSRDTGLNFRICSNYLYIYIREPFPNSGSYLGFFKNDIAYVINELQDRNFKLKLLTPKSITRKYIETNVAISDIFRDQKEGYIVTQPFFLFIILNHIWILIFIVSLQLQLASQNDRIICNQSNFLAVGQKFKQK